MKADFSGKNILIIKPGAIGDLLQLTPAIRALASGFPGSRISLMVGTETTATLFQHHPQVAETIVFDRRGEHRTLGSILKLWLRIRRGRYSLLVHFQRSNLKAWFLASAAFPCRLLVYHKTRGRVVHVVDDYLKTLGPLGISAQDRSLELHVGGDDEGFAEESFARNGIGGKTVIALNAGASHAVNRWGAAKFAQLADLLTERLSAKIILVGGGEDRALAEEISEAAAASLPVFCGTATLLQTGAILRKCALLISGDTGPLHMAAAVGTRALALFGAADPERTGPVGPEHRVIQAKGVACVPCRSRTCTKERYLECMESISVQEVAEAAMDMVRDR